MVRVTKSDPDPEDAIKSLISAFKVAKLSAACGILFVSGDCLTLSAEMEQMGLVSLHGPPQANAEGSEFLVNESQAHLIEIAHQALPHLLQKLAEPIVSASISVAAIENEGCQHKRIKGEGVARAPLRAKRSNPPFQRTRLLRYPD